MSSTLHICAPAPTERKLMRMECPTCKRRTFFTVWFYEWYGPSETCLRCGEHWNDGERSERPFARGWRQRSIADAKRMWRAAAAVKESP